MYYYIDLVLTCKESHNILLNKQYRLYYSVDYKLINIGSVILHILNICNYAMIYSKPFGILRTYTFLCTFMFCLKFFQ